MSQGVIYAKIARKDDNGEDNTLSLQELTDLRVKFSDAGIVDYKIATIAEYPTYYLYTIITKNVTSSLDNNVLDHHLVATSSIASIPPTPFSGGQVFYLTSSWTATIDTLNYFNSGSYVLGDTPNIPIIYTASLNVTLSQGDIFLLALAKHNNNNPLTLITSSAYTLNAGTHQLIISGSTNQFIENDIVEMYSGFNTSSFTVNSFTWVITQSVNPNSSSNLTVLEPYLTSNFEYSDCNVLLNNADYEGVNSLYERVLYNDGSVIPSNYQQILSRSAELADVKDYYYALKAQTLPRYEGVRTESPNFNATSSIGIGGVSNVESLKIVSAYCNSINSWAPEKMGSSAVKIIYLIDENGGIITPDTTENSLFTNKFSFISGERALIKSNGTGSGNINPYKNIFRGGARIEPILYTQIGIDPTETWASQIELVDIIGGSGGAVFDATATANGSISVNNGFPNYLPIYPNLTDYRLITWTQTSGNPSLFSSTAPGKIYVVPPEMFTDNLTLKIELGGYIVGYYTYSPMYSSYSIFVHKVFLRQDRKIGGVYQYYKDHNIQLRQSPPVNSGTIPLSYNIKRSFGESWPGLSVTFSTSDDIQVDDKFYFVISPGMPSGINVVTYGDYVNNINFKVSQTPAPTSPIPVGNNSIWGYPDPTNYPNVITSSNSTLTSLYPANPTDDSNIRMKDIANSEFNPVVLPWSIKQADEFRFEGIENEMYVVDKVYGPNEGITSPYSASLDLTNIASEASTLGSSSFSLNGINFYYTGSNTSNISNYIYINTSSFTNSTVNDYVTTSSIIFNYSSSVAPYSASLTSITAVESSSNLVFYYGGPNSSLPTLISGSTTISFGGGSQTRISPQGSIEVHFTRNLNPSASVSTFNLDHFLIRRYVDDASQIIIDGFAPTGSVGPYLVTPEFITSKLSKNIDKYIIDLTQKGLIQ